MAFIESATATIGFTQKAIEILKTIYFVKKKPNIIIFRKGSEVKKTKTDDKVTWVDEAYWEVSNHSCHKAYKPIVYISSNSLVDMKLVDRDCDLSPIAKIGESNLPFKMVFMLTNPPFLKKIDKKVLKEKGSFITQDLLFDKLEFYIEFENERGKKYYLWYHESKFGIHQKVSTKKPDYDALPAKPLPFIDKELRA